MASAEHGERKQHGGEREQTGGHSVSRKLELEAVCEHEPL
jgi:hypothetical protein